MSHVIQHLVMPSLAFDAPEEMYVRMRNDNVRANLSEGRLQFDANGRVSFDTFFNSITIDIWKTHTKVIDLQLHLRGSGRFMVRFGLNRIGHAHRWLAEHFITLNPDQDALIPVDSWPILKNGMLYFSLEAMEPGSIIAGHFATITAPQRAVKLGIVITHFNRKQWVLPAITRIRNELLNDPLYKGRIELVVVDNSQNITAEEAEGITLIPNKNLGGSGGFTRGLLHLKDHGGFTHCLFMDDDASCEIESIRRAYNLIRHNNTSELAISGSLLRETNPSILHEKGGSFIGGGWRPLKHGLDMRHLHDLLEAENQRENIDYGAWWFFIFDISYPKHFAFPFFVRGDDAQFGLQNNFNIVTLNGVGCWGEDFWLKEGPLTRYLSARATFVIDLCFSSMSLLSMIKVMTRWFTTSLFSQNYASARAVNLAILHFIKGPSFFMKNIDTSEIIKHITSFSSSEKMIPMKKTDLIFAYPKNHESKLRKTLRFITLNGILLPSILYKETPIFQEKHFRAIYRQVFLRKSIFYYSEPIGFGYVTKLNKKIFFTESFKFFALCLRFLFIYKKLLKEYKESIKSSTTEKFWRNIYK